MNSEERARAILAYVSEAQCEVFAAADAATELHLCCTDPGVSGDFHALAVQQASVNALRALFAIGRHTREFLESVPSTTSVKG